MPLHGIVRPDPDLAAPDLPGLPTGPPPARTYRVLVTGATGYIGGRLVPRLLERGHEVRVLVREPHRIRGRSWARRVDVAVGDLSDASTIEKAFDGMERAVYLVHSMSSSRSFAARDRRAARHFAEAAGSIDHTVYLGGLQPHDAEPSEHLASRAEVGRILADHGPTTELRAGPIIGSGSASFEMVRYLCERIPVMVVPRVILNHVQPIAIRDVLSYLVLSIERPPGGVVEIGGTDRLSFREMLETYARARRLARWVVPLRLPFAPRLASWWVGLVTPVPYDLATPLIGSLRRTLVADTTRARSLYPEVEPITYRRAVKLALSRLDEGRVETHWSGALGSGPTYERIDWEGLSRDVRTVHVPAPPEAVYRSFSQLGGDTGWLVWTWAWSLRGWLDRLVGGPGLRRGRRHPTELLSGEAIDFWRVDTVDPPRLLRLRAEMRLPGKAWLQWEASPEGDGTRLLQTAAFGPRGLFGALYWYSLYPIHGRIFEALVDALAARAVEEHARETREAQADVG